MGKFYSTKTYGNDRGLSCCFRQWRATHSHCSLMHGYSIGIKLTFECDTLDDKNWCMDFGGLKEFKEWADHMFDHTMIIAEDDPFIESFKLMGQAGAAQVRILPAVGAEKFAEYVYNKLQEFVNQETEGRVKIARVEFMENGKNSAIYEG